MPPSVEDRLQDILEAIAEIDKMLAGYNLQQFSTENMRRMATERYLGIICEAAAKLPDHLKQAEREIDWRGMNDFGNRLRHAYHATDVAIVWEVIQNDLPPLKSFAQRQTGASGK